MVSFYHKLGTESDNESVVEELRRRGDGAVGSALIGGVLATGYDVYKGGVYELSPNEVGVKMQSTTAMVI